MMKETIYIPPDSEDYAGYTTYVLTGTSTSELEVFSLPTMKEHAPSVIERDYEEKEAKDYGFPETREERFLDRDLIEFYRKRDIRPK